MSDEPPRPFPGCPHADIRDCPLYAEAHNARLPHNFGCDDGQLMWGGCAADRKWPYAEQLARLRAVDPRLVAEIEFEADARRHREQRQRNMRAAGIH